MLTQTAIYWTGEGVYVPSVVISPNGKYKHITWTRDITGNPFVGVQVDSYKAARRMGKVARNTRWGFRFEE